MLRAFARRVWSRLPRSLLPPLRERGDKVHDPKCLPSLGDIHALAWTASDSVGGHVMFSAKDRSSAPLRSRLLVYRFRVTRGCRALDPRPRASPRFVVFIRNADTRFSGSDCRPTTSATTSNVRAHPRASDSREISKSRMTQRLRAHPRSRHASYGVATFPSRRRITRATSRDSPSETALTALQARREIRLRRSSTDRNAACGRRLDPTIACGGGRWTTTMDCTGRITPSEGSPLPPPAAAG
jgi:hypothetical protein